jgi:hypothetical protein
VSYTRHIFILLKINHLPSPFLNAENNFLYREIFARRSILCFHNAEALTRPMKRVHRRAGALGA